MSVATLFTKYCDSNYRSYYYIPYTVYGSSSAHVNFAKLCQQYYIVLQVK